MKVLFVCPWLPWPPDDGGRIRTYQLLRSLSGRAEVHLGAVLDGSRSEEAVEALAPHCASVRAFERGRPAAVERWTRTKLERWFHSPALRLLLASHVPTLAVRPGRPQQLGRPRWRRAFSRPELSQGHVYRSDAASVIRPPIAHLD